MIWSSAAEFWAMGGHGAFVWGSFGVSLALMVAEPLWALARKRSALQEPLPDEFDEAPDPSEQASLSLQEPASQSMPQREPAQHHSPTPGGNP